MATSLPCFFRAYVVDRSAYFCFLVFMSLTEAIIFSFWCLCRCQERLFLLFGAYVVVRSAYFCFLVLHTLYVAFNFLHLVFLR